MKPYLIITGTLFGLLSALHLWRVIAEWHTADPVSSIFMVAITILTAVLSAWAWRLLQGRPASKKIS